MDRPPSIPTPHCELALRYYRIHRGISQRQLADLVGMTQPDISLVESGRLNLTPDELARIAQVLNFSPPEALLRRVAVVLEDVAP